MATGGLEDTADFHPLLDAKRMRLMMGINLTKASHEAQRHLWDCMAIAQHQDKAISTSFPETDASMALFESNKAQITEEPLNAREQQILDAARARFKQQYGEDMSGEVQQKFRRGLLRARKGI
ncbi:MAG: hypothetical protein K9M03_02850 [Kiritimatiellales bacterium]|nr:hypothetical protein [Kiritimatiellales bacterium]